MIQPGNYQAIAARRRCQGGSQNVEQLELQPHLLQCLHQEVESRSWHSKLDMSLREEGIWRGSPRVQSKLLPCMGLHHQDHLEALVCSGAWQLSNKNVGLASACMQDDWVVAAQLAPPYGHDPPAAFTAGTGSSPPASVAPPTPAGPLAAQWWHGPDGAHCSRSSQHACMRSAVPASGPEGVSCA